MLKGNVELRRLNECKHDGYKNFTTLFKEKESKVKTRDETCLFYLF